MNTALLQCRDEKRRDAVRAKAGLNGLDYLEVSDDQLSLSVFFLGKAPQSIAKENIVISGGRIQVKVTGLEVLREEDPELDDSLQISLDRYGDFSNYTLCLVQLDDQGKPTDLPMSGFDLRYACLDFNFKVGCASDLDCKNTPICPPRPKEIPEINYLAKDYASFRQLIYDRLALLNPDWQERHVPDLGVTLVELLAYVGDQLSYYQDAVGTEAYLDTARQRISVRRHARLVDYVLHEGCNARAWVCLSVSSNLSLNPKDFYFLTNPDGLPGSKVLKPEELPAIKNYRVYEPLLEQTQKTIELYAAHNSIRIYTWNDAQCCLVQGATSAALLDPGTTEHLLKLAVCDVILFEEVKGAKTGNPADADPTHRHAVRLTSVKNTIDPLNGQLIVEVGWGREDALPFAVCVSSVNPNRNGASASRFPHPDPLPEREGDSRRSLRDFYSADCSLIEDVTLVCGNVILVDQGESVTEQLDPVPGIAQLPGCDECCGEREAFFLTGWYRPGLTRTDLTFSQPLSADTTCRGEFIRRLKRPLPSCNGPASSLLKQDMRKALPQIALYETGTAWQARADLLASHAEDRHFVAEIKDDRTVQLRFGDGELGRAPTPGKQFEARYRIGNGSLGNVGAEAINSLVFKNNFPNGVGIQLRNPMPAQGGVDPEPLAEAKLLAPHAFKDILQRAVTADDYAQIVMRDFKDKVQRAKASFRWTGSGYEVLLAIDPWAATEAVPQLLCEIGCHLRLYRRIGHDLQVVLAESVALEVALDICVLPGFLQAHVKSALLDVLSNRMLANGQKGFFHPDNLSFGEGIYLSQLIAAAQGVKGVKNVTVNTFKRLFEAADDEIANGLLPLKAMEIARLDNDPNFPENGKLSLIMEGGR